ncbi:hypothetical protein JCM19992_11200 [Thermostilla marina]
MHKTIITLAAVVSFGLGLPAFAETPKVNPMQIVYQGEAQLMQARAAMINAQANFIKSLAAARQSEAQRLATMEQTRGLRIDNSLKACKTYYDRRQVRDAYVSLQVKSQASPSDSKHAAPVQQTAAVRMQGLTPAEVDSVTRQLKWPAALLDARYAKLRNELQALYAARKPSDCGVGSDYYVKVRNVTDRLKTALRSQIRELSPSDYMAARKFLDRMVVDAIQAPAAANVAQAF